MKKILIYSGQDQIGDAIIKLPFLFYLRKQFPKDNIIWMTNLGSAYSQDLNIFINNYLDEIWDNADLNLYPWQKISSNYPLHNKSFDIIIDTQKSVKKTLILKRIKTKVFISSTARWIFSTLKPKSYKKKKQYYLNDLLEILSLCSNKKIINNFTLEVPKLLDDKLGKFFTSDNNYFGIAPGAGQANKIWNIDNYIKLAKHFQKKNFKIVFFLGPLEKTTKQLIISNLDDIIFPEELLVEFNGPQIVMASTKFLKCAVSNDSGTSHMLSTDLCPLIKLFGPKDAKKFTPSHLKKIYNIKALDFGNNNIDNIPLNFVINKSEEIMNI